MSPRLSLSHRQSRLTATRSVIDAGVGLMLYTGSPSPKTESATPETLLATITLAPGVGDIGASGDTATLTAAVPRVGLAVASGLVGWARQGDSAGLGVMDLTVGLPGSGAQVILSDLQLYAGGEAQLLSYVIAE